MTSKADCIAYDTVLKRPACVLLQTLMGCDYNVAHHFPSESWLTAITPNLKVYPLKPGQLERLVAITEANRRVERQLEMTRIRTIRTGPLTDEDLETQVGRITSHVEEVVMPTRDVDCTHYWVLLVNGVRTAYFGTPESFAVWQAEQNPQ